MNAPKYDIELSFGCRELINLDIMTLTDPFIKIYEQISGNWKLLGQTEVVFNNLNPNFSKSVKVEFYFETNQNIRIEVYHHDSETKHDLIDQVDFLLAQLMGNKDNILELVLSKKKGNV
jgi:Ca2+-dependent lipid-binding protein